jgi:hypothetical protein
MTADERRRAFADAFIAQARSDWDAYRVLAGRPARRAREFLPW